MCKIAIAREHETKHSTDDRTNCTAKCLPEMQQKGIKGVILAEKDISNCIPFNCFNLQRFAILQDDLDKFIELCKQSKEFNDIEVNELINEILTK